MKYRSSVNQGGGLAAITPRKLTQMQFAAACYTHKHNLKGDQLLLVADVDKAGQITLFEVS